MPKHRQILILLALGFLTVGILIYASGNPSLAPEDKFGESSNKTQTQSEENKTSENSTSTTITTVKNMQHVISIETSLGTIRFQTYDADAPLAVNNFIQLANKGYYNNVIFHRIIKGFMVQGGDPTGTGRGGPGYTFADELNPNTDSAKQGYAKGVVAMANAGPNTNGSQFFIMLEDYPLPHNYTIFGKVIEGQNVVDAMGNLPTGAGDRPVTPPVIKSVSVSESN